MHTVVDYMLVLLWLANFVVLNSAILEAERPCRNVSPNKLEIRYQLC